MPLNSEEYSLHDQESNWNAAKLQKKSMQLGVPLGASKILRRIELSTFSSSSMSFIGGEYHASEFRRILFRNKEVRYIRVTSKKNGPKQTSSSIDMICFLIPTPLPALGRIFFLFLPSAVRISPRYFSDSDISTKVLSPSSSSRSNLVFRWLTAFTFHVSMKVLDKSHSSDQHEAYDICPRRTEAFSDLPLHSEMSSFSVILPHML